MAVMRCEGCNRFINEANFDYDKFKCFDCVAREEEEETQAKESSCRKTESN